MVAIKIRDKEKLNAWLLSYGFNQTLHEGGYLYLNFNDKSLKWDSIYNCNYPLVNPEYDVLGFKSGDIIVDELGNTFMFNASNFTIPKSSRQLLKYRLANPEEVDYFKLEALNNGCIINGDKIIPIQDTHVYVETKNGQKAIAKIKDVKDGKIYRYESYFLSTDFIYTDTINPVLVYTKDVKYIRLATEEEISKFNNRVAINNFQKGDIIYIEAAGQTFIGKYKNYNGILNTYFDLHVNLDEIDDNPIQPLCNRIDDIDRIRLAGPIEIETLKLRLLKEGYIIKNNSLVKIKDGDYIYLTTKSGIDFISKFEKITENNRIRTYYDYSIYGTCYFYDNRSNDGYVTSVSNVKSIRFATKEEIEKLESYVKPTELTLEEIAEKFGIDVKQLKIKK